MTPHIDPERMRADAKTIKDTLLDRAAEALDKAGDLAEQGIDWAAPRVADAREKATPVVKDAAAKAAAAAQEAAERATAAAQEAAEKAQPMLNQAQQRISEDYLPRVNRAVHDAQAAASIDGDLAERARAVRAASAAALTQPTAVAKRRGRGVGKALGLTALGAGVAGVGWILWKRSQPIEDPWAEEYWADLEAKSTDTWGDTPVESADGTAHGFASAASAVAEDVPGMTPADIAKGAAAVVAGGQHGVQPDGKKLEKVDQIDEDVAEGKKTVDGETGFGEDAAADGADEKKPAAKKAPAKKSGGAAKK